ncbi:MAG: YaiI/YqxD family protein [Candidatus Wallbacteria bacterium HGW-Wallbacteria-1]|jgi:hypothetical protein|uniref:UPF0178 protein CVV64_11405 n=1 Tax=Candidatus Wallbacteria bacterium HGW-Wallbacteria-1 TaxID=2013854 RepID=A0A2N1PNN3_9BACT|nr:MAG: YaiI/YqxD family protein [Candidatus Wallbacteria bacterium HGW-Wallbacteria-1]
MKIWVDSDACPRPVKEMLYRAAQKRQIMVTLVANQPMRVPSSPFIETVLVEAGPDVADETIIRLMEPGDLVVTADIPLASGVVDCGGLAIDPRGVLFTRDNIRERLLVRDMMDLMRGSGLVTGGPPPFNSSDRQAFANQIDRILTASLQS